ncbi:hypothetical protein C482_07591 [Natrialba chahannaoensis JCM 10990]|uniref:Uncharacterized protein n=1 Tax=Natrialba chahannaoensis JCM 10990 TaxID=1227492 RepID=M0ARA1_9EURY|nr:hypothetical protein C482_07591 [Natrialba chahannaoensis JCM 10990]
MSLVSGVDTSEDELTIEYRTDGDLLNRDSASVGTDSTFYRESSLELLVPEGEAVEIFTNYQMTNRLRRTAHTNSVATVSQIDGCSGSSLQHLI